MPWNSATFSGERVTIQFQPENPAQFLTQMSTFDMDANIAGWLICDVSIALDYTITILLLEQ